MKKGFTIFAVGLLVIIISMVHLSCSSDSGGGGGESTSPPATLDESNVDQTVNYVAQAVPGCSKGTVMTANQVLLDAITMMKRQAENKRVQMFSTSNMFQPEEAIDPPIEGICGGTITGDISGNNQTGNLSGDISLNDYCLGEPGSSVVIDGSLSFSGTVNPDTGDLEQLSGSSSGINILVEDAGQSQSYSISFDASISMGGDTINITIDEFTFSDDTEGIEIKLLDFNMTIIEGDTSTSVTMSGTIDVTDEGSVQFQTVGPITISEDGSTMSGTFVATGADNTQIQVTIVDGMFNIQADTDGDGTFDYESCLDCTGVAVGDITF
jgi:hypothetical protein